MNEKILVTGGAGFIGSHVVDIYVENGYKVFIADNLYSGKKENINKKAKFIKIDIRDKKIKDLIFDEKIDYINHHAAQISVSKSVVNPYFDAELNILGTINILNSCVKSKVKKIIFASSGGTVYGEIKKFPVTEDLPLNPINPYGISKVACENYLKFYFKEYNLKYVALRYSNVYGPRQDPFGEAGVVAIFCFSLIKGKIPTINGDGKYIRDYVYCRDVAKANLLALKSNIVGAFNVGTGKGTDVNALFFKLTKIFNFKENPKYGPPRPGDLRKSILNYDLIKNKLNWMPETGLESGLIDTVEWFKKVNR